MVAESMGRRVVYDNPNPHSCSDEGGWGTRRVSAKIRKTGQALARNITIRYAGYQEAGKKDGG